MKRLIVFGFVLFLATGLFAQGGSESGGESSGERRPEIGDTDPGGGMIYYIDGNEFWECSGDLGVATWGQAGIDARNYRGGYNDWSLPSVYGLGQMYYNLKLSGIGGLADVDVLIALME